MESATAAVLLKCTGERLTSMDMCLDETVMYARAGEC